jgi:hypothetical protein
VGKYEKGLLELSMKEAEMHNHFIRRQLFNIALAATVFLPDSQISIIEMFVKCLFSSRLMLDSFNKVNCNSRNICDLLKSLVAFV